MKLGCNCSVNKAKAWPDILSHPVLRSIQKQTIPTANTIITVLPYCVYTPKNTIAVITSEACLVIDVLISCNLFHLIDTLAAFVTNWSSTGTLLHVFHHTLGRNVVTIVYHT